MITWSSAVRFNSVVLPAASAMADTTLATRMTLRMILYPVAAAPRTTRAITSTFIHADCFGTCSVGAAATVRGMMGTGAGGGGVAVSRLTRNPEVGGNRVATGTGGVDGWFAAKDCWMISFA